MKKKVFLSIILLLMSIPAIWLTGCGEEEPFIREDNLVFDKVHSPSLENNLGGDSATRDVTIYLPPDYDADPDKRYPVLYLLHGYGGNESLWTGEGYQWPEGTLLSGLNIDRIADTLIQQGKMKPMILVAPDASNRYGGSFYTNSDLTGNWEDFITQDVIAYIDRNYRTLPQAASRGIAGHSMGGYGAIKLAMKHPDTYSAVYSLSAAPLGPGDDPEALKAVLADLNFDETALADLSFEDISFEAQGIYATAAAFSPNLFNAPFFIDIPLASVGAELVPIEPAWSKWLANFPLTMLEQFGPNFLQLRGVRFDVGTSDDAFKASINIPQTNRIFSQALTAAGIPHVFEEYDGNHFDRIQERIETKVLPFFSETLAFEIQPTVEQ